jgi:hypothetical protein
MSSTKTITITANAPFSKSDVSSDPNPAHVHHADERIVFKIGGNSSSGVVFTGLTANPDDQLGAPAISADGQQMTVADIDNVKETIHYTLHLSDGSGRAFTHDPQIINNPRI